MAPPPYKPDRSIALVGLMGAGKTSVGKRLAQRLRLPFVDSDSEIETAAGMTVADMFARHGEAQFRDGERRVIARLVAASPRVIATGGGAFADPETRALMLERCRVVWLDASIETLAKRVGRKDTRPLLFGKDPIRVLGELAERRNPLYAEAHIRVRSHDEPHAELVELIIQSLMGR